MTWLICLTSGTVIGLVFSLLKIPVPTPDTFEGVCSLIGLCIGSYFLPTLFYVFMKGG